MFDLFCCIFFGTGDVKDSDVLFLIVFLPPDQVVLESKARSFHTGLELR